MIRYQGKSLFHIYYNLFFFFYKGEVIRATNRCNLQCNIVALQVAAICCSYYFTFNTFFNTFLNASSAPSDRSADRSDECIGYSEVGSNQGSTPQLVLFHGIFSLRLCLRAPSLNNAVYVLHRLRIAYSKASKHIL